MKARVLGAVAAALLLAGCGGTSEPGSPTSSGPSGSITVFAASSLTAAFGRIGADFQKTFPGTMIHFAFAGSSTLVAQIQQGAIGDVLASADQPNMQKLVNAGLTSGSPSIFARNKLQIVVPAGNPKHVTGLADLGRAGLVVVLCASAVPCGHYATEALQKAGVRILEPEKPAAPPAAAPPSPLSSLRREKLAAEGASRPTSSESVPVLGTAASSSALFAIGSIAIFSACRMHVSPWAALCHL